MSLHLSIKRRFNKLLRILLRQREVKIHGVVVLLDVMPEGHAIKEIDRRTYEEAEAALVIHYIPPRSTVVELGASLGIISSVIGKTVPLRMLCVEAAPELAAAARRTLARNCPEVPCKVLACAIAPTDGMLLFDCARGQSLVGKAADSAGKKHAVELPAKRLSTVLTQEAVDDPFYLVCDIEGMEAAVFLDDPGALTHCVGIILESHHTEYHGRKFSPDQIFGLCEGLGFELIERRGNAAYLNRIAR